MCISYHIISYHIISYHIISYHIYIYDIYIYDIYRGRERTKESIAQSLHPCRLVPFLPGSDIIVRTAELPRLENLARCTICDIEGPPSNDRAGTSHGKIS